MFCVRSIASLTGVRTISGGVGVDDGTVVEGDTEGGRPVITVVAGRKKKIIAALVAIPATAPNMVAPVRLVRWGCITVVSGANVCSMDVFLLILIDDEIMGWH